MGGKAILSFIFVLTIIFILYKFKEIKKLFKKNLIEGLENVPSLSLTSEQAIKLGENPLIMGIALLLLVIFHFALIVLIIFVFKTTILSLTNNKN